MRGGARVGTGPKGPTGPRKRVLTAGSPGVVCESKTPLEYMLDVMNNPEAEQGRRDRMAMAAAPFVHAKADLALEGKKAQRQITAEEASSVGPFAVPDSPRPVTH